MDIQRSFASNMRRFRKAAHLSQEKLAELAGLHRTYIGGIEQRRVNVSLKNIGKIAAALDVDPAALFLADSPSQDLIQPKSSGNSTLQRKAAREREHELKPGEAAVVIWSDDGVTFRPIELESRDLTTHVLVELIEKGYSGDELMERYHAIVAEIDLFLSR